MESIQSDLPVLLKGQQSDVVFAEKRLLLNKGQGVLFTNGTGTGKTYTGLGLVKRYLNQGKKNILIVAPSNEIIAAWKDAARKDFGINAHQLSSVVDKGKDVTITTYANLQDNNAVLTRDWDLIITDEAHNLMNNEKGVPTGALNKLRAMTYHDKAFRMRFDFVAEITNKDIVSVDKKIRELTSRLQGSKKLNKESKLDIQPVSNEKIEEIQSAIKGLETKKATINNELEAERREQIEIWQSMPKENKPKVVFLSATPFAYVKNIDYAEGYLFEYPPTETGYNIAGGFEKFMIENFGYRMMYNKLTIPEGKVDNRIMEVGFHEKLKKDGVLSARKLEVTADYERGFLLVEKGIGAKIDEGFEWFFDNDNASFRELGEALSKQFNGRIRNYMLESIKSRGAIDIVKQYLKNGKKVVIFHDSKKVQNVIHPFKLDISKLREKDDAKELRNQYARFKAKRPDLVNMDLSSLVSPISTFEKAFGDDIMFFNGDVSVKKRSENVKNFNDDNSGKNIIMVQSDAGNAGISLHDTTGKYQRVLINIGIPRRPSYATQIEGRIFRLGSVSNAIIRYLSTGTNVEKWLFANTIASRASTAENLAMGEDARNLRDSYVSLFTETLDGTWENRLPGAEGEGTGGKELDSIIGKSLSEFERAKTFYYGQQKRNSRNKSREGIDYFATPEPVGLKMVEWAGLVDGETVLEPSAGHGAISRFFSPNTPSVIIEPSSRLAPLAQMNTDGATFSKGSFESYHLVNKFNAVIMNPPYGTAGKTAMEHLEKAFKHLKNGG